MRSLAFVVAGLLGVGCQSDAIVAPEPTPVPAVAAEEPRRAPFHLTIYHSADIPSVDNTLIAYRNVFEREGLEFDAHQEDFRNAMKTAYARSLANLVDTNPSSQFTCNIPSDIDARYDVVTVEPLPEQSHLTLALATTEYKQDAVAVICSGSPTMLDNYFFNAGDSGQVPDDLLRKAQQKVGHVILVTPYAAGPEGSDPLYEHPIAQEVADLLQVPVVAPQSDVNVGILVPRIQFNRRTKEVYVAENDQRLRLTADWMTLGPLF